MTPYVYGPTLFLPGVHSPPNRPTGGRADRPVDRRVRGTLYFLSLVCVHVRASIVTKSTSSDRPTGRPVDRPAGRPADRPTHRSADGLIGRQTNARHLAFLVAGVCACAYTRCRQVNVDRPARRPTHRSADGPTGRLRCARHFAFFAFACAQLRRHTVTKSTSTDRLSSRPADRPAGPTGRPTLPSEWQ